MRIKELLENKSHRPWELPCNKWKYYQEWNKAIFLHWQVNLDVIRPFVHDDLGIDLYKGKAWVSVVAFTMEKVRPRILPAFSPISNFNEVNIRTYVKYKGKAGVYFLSIEAGKRISCKIAKLASGLPYRHSRMIRKDNYYYSNNVANAEKLEFRYIMGEALTEKSEIDIWLTERYALFQDKDKRINTFDIHHVEWPINSIDLVDIKVDYPRFETLINDKPDLMHYSNGVEVLAWDKK